MIDWVTISALGTAVATLALASATFSSVRAANRPVLTSSRIYDPEDKIRFFEGLWVKVKGSHGYASVTKDTIYFVMSLRNAGHGLAVIDRWSVFVGDITHDGEHLGEIDGYRRTTRDLYIEAGENGLWQGAIRDPKDPDFAKIAETIKKRGLIRLDVMYADQEGGQRTVTRFALSPARKKNDWLVSTARHWRLDGNNPR